MEDFANRRSDNCQGAAGNGSFWPVPGATADLYLRRARAGLASHRKMRFIAVLKDLQAEGVPRAGSRSVDGAAYFDPSVPDQYPRYRAGRWPSDLQAPTATRPMARWASAIAVCRRMRTSVMQGRNIWQALSLPTWINATLVANRCDAAGFASGVTALSVSAKTHTVSDRFRCHAAGLPCLHHKLCRSGRASCRA